jgi:hypothetical protein
MKQRSLRQKGRFMFHFLCLIVDRLMLGVWRDKI